MASAPPSAPSSKLHRMHRIGLYGGAFDPPHWAHVNLAAAAVQQLRLDRLYVIPTGQPWMKQRQLTAATHRLHMAQLAFASVPQATVDDCELRRSGTTYTIDTLRELQQRHTASADSHTTDISWFLIMGQDLLETLPQWQRAQELLREVSIAVLPRPPNSPMAHTTPDLSKIATLEAQAVAEKSGSPRIVRLHLPPSNISSSAIRQELQQRATQTRQERLLWLQSLVPSAVARYIEHHQLYSSTHTDVP